MNDNAKNAPAGAGCDEVHRSLLRRLAGGLRELELQLRMTAAAEDAVELKRALGYGPDQAPAAAAVPELLALAAPELQTDRREGWHVPMLLRSRDGSRVALALRPDELPEVEIPAQVWAVAMLRHCGPAQGFPISAPPHPADQRRTSLITQAFLQAWFISQEVL